jgi:hypothetical protein
MKDRGADLAMIAEAKQAVQKVGRGGGKRVKQFFPFIKIVYNFAPGKSREEVVIGKESRSDV